MVEIHRDPGMIQKPEYQPAGNHVLPAREDGGKRPEIPNTDPLRQSSKSRCPPAGIAT